MAVAAVTTSLVALAAPPAHALARQATKAPAGASAEVQWWHGIVELPMIPAFDYIVVFRSTDTPGEYEATLDIPVQGAVALPLIDVRLTEEQIAFTIGPPANAVHTLERSKDGKTATGFLEQHGMKFPMRMERITEERAKSVGPDRPQTPKPPFPYKEREITYVNKADDTKHAGTLTIPDGRGPHPCVLMITGSGSQDRDETIFGHKPFLVIADHLTRNGIAVLRVDDRGIGGSDRGTDNPTTVDFAGDVRAGVDFLKEQPELDARRIGLIGHSEGGIIAPMVASESDDIACIVMLAGPGLSGGEILHMQNEALFKAGGAPADRVHDVLEAMDAVLRLVREGADEEALRPAARKLVKAQMAAQPAISKLARSPKQMDDLAAAAVKQFRSAWITWFVKHDPRPVLRRVKCPVLALNGSLDLQVLPKENLSAIETALRSGGNTDVTVRELRGLNHLFQEAKVGTVAEYGTLTQTVSPKALDEITNWLRAQLKPAAQD